MKNKGCASTLHLYLFTVHHSWRWKLHLILWDQPDEAVARFISFTRQITLLRLFCSSGVLIGIITPNKGQSLGQNELTHCFLHVQSVTLGSLGVYNVMFFFTLASAFYLLDLSTPCGSCGDVGTLRAKPPQAAVLSATWAPRVVDSACRTSSLGRHTVTADTPGG